MLKINLSGSGQQKKDIDGDESVIHLSDNDTTAPMPDNDDDSTKIQSSETGEGAQEAVKSPAETVSETTVSKDAAKKTQKKPKKKKEKKEKSGKSRMMQYLVALLAVSALALVYVNKDVIMSMLTQREETPPPAPAPPPEPVVDEQATDAEEPDPAFVVMNKISEVFPDGIWLSSVMIDNNGDYKLRGIAFSYPAIGTFLKGLESSGTISERVIPSEKKSLEEIYNFSIGGTVAGIKVPEILDIIPTDDLIKLAAPVLKRSEELGVKFNRTPTAGQTYGENDLPFSLEGTYQSLKDIISELCPVDGNIRIYKIEILPATAGKPYDMIKASFSLRTVSPI